MRIAQRSTDTDEESCEQLIYGKYLEDFWGPPFRTHIVHIERPDSVKCCSPRPTSTALNTHRLCLHPEYESCLQAVSAFSKAMDSRGPPQPTVQQLR